MFLVTPAAWPSYQRFAESVQRSQAWLLTYPKASTLLEGIPAPPPGGEGEGRLSGLHPSLQLPHCEAVSRAMPEKQRGE